MPAIQTVCIAVLLVIALLFDKCFGYPPTRLQIESEIPCEERICRNKCNECPAGFTFSSICGEEVCKKGLGEICGGQANRYGICGEGMFCKCHRCSGCSVTDLNCMREQHDCTIHENPFDYRVPPIES
ncbi:queen brain-selective protein-1 isoform X2 [Colletes latitarsis]|uniref:queen brain-selective protein-1 isoform X2 n=1 Tax=Colletes latitarsis TaxID=2605962 RepID=UPI00403746C9